MKQANVIVIYDISCFVENFMNSLVTFDDLSSNPALLNDPKLVVRINDR